MRNGLLMRIYKVLRRSEHRSLLEHGMTKGSLDDQTDGFIHFSTATQLGETLSRHFAGETDLELVAVDADSLGEALKWEPSRGGQLFPHLYAELALDMVVQTQPIASGPSGHILPPDLV